MSHKKPKPGQNNIHPRPKQPEGEEKSTNRHVYVEPGAKIDFVLDVKTKFDSAQRGSETHNNKQLFWTKVASGFLLVNAVIAGLQVYWTTGAIQAANRSAAAADTANVNFVESNRPWIGSMPASKPDEFPQFARLTDQSGEFIRIKFIWIFKNSGKRPGRVTGIFTTADSYRACSEKPDYDALQPGKISITPFGNGSASRAFMIPDTVVKSDYETTIPLAAWNKIQEPNSSLHYCVYSLIEYQDVANPKVTHRTKDCRVLIPLINNSFAECANDYPDAD
jgi:hypothetical protein